MVPWPEGDPRNVLLTVQQQLDIERGILVVVDRARFERVRAFAEATIAWEGAKTGDFRAEVVALEARRARRAFAALQPGDLDPLP